MLVAVGSVVGCFLLGGFILKYVCRGEDDHALLGGDSGGDKAADEAYSRELRRRDQICAEHEQNAKACFSAGARRFSHATCTFSHQQVRTVLAADITMLAGPAYAARPVVDCSLDIGGSEWLAGARSGVPAC